MSQDNVAIHELSKLVNKFANGVGLDDTELGALLDFFEIAEDSLRILYAMDKAYGFAHRDVATKLHTLNEFSRCRDRN